MSRKKRDKRTDIVILESQELVAPPELASDERVKKNGKGLATASLIFSILSLPCLFTGLIPLQIAFLVLALIFHAIDRKVNGKRGISVFSLICTIVTFIMIFSTLTYCTILFAFGMYTAFVNPEPYNNLMNALKSIGGSVLSVFGISL